MIRKRHCFFMFLMVMLQVAVNATTVILQNAGGSIVCEDSYIYNKNPAENYGASDSLYLYR